MRPLTLAVACLSLAACSTPPPPAPGEAPGWPRPEPPRSHFAIPLPFTNTYLPPGPAQPMPPVAPGDYPPYAVRGGELPPAQAVPPPNCHAVPTVTVDGKASSTVCQNADGAWVHVPDAR